MTEEYLGDGVYASFDGHQVWLRTPREGGDNTIALEPYTMNALFAYYERMNPRDEEAVS